MGSLRTLQKDKIRTKRPDAVWVMGGPKKDLYIEWNETSHAGLSYVCRVDYNRLAHPRPTIELILYEPVESDRLQMKFVSIYKDSMDFRTARDLLSNWYYKLREGNDWSSVIDFPSCWEKDTHWGNYGWSRDFIIEEILNRYCRVYSGLS
jgi:hypothetical protein